MDKAAILQNKIVEHTEKIRELIYDAGWTALQEAIREGDIGNEEDDLLTLFQTEAKKAYKAINLLNLYWAEFVNLSKP